MSSVGGSLATYHVQKRDETTYKAVLQPANSNRNDIPAEIILQKQGDSWQAEPPNSDIVPGLINAIEAGGGLK